MNTKTTILGQQIEWARAASRGPDAKGYLKTIEQDLFQALSSASRAAFDRGDGSELKPVGGRPPKMTALHSSSALAINFFDYWSGRPLDVIARALGLPRVPQRFEFEVQYPTGLEGNPPNLDLVFFHSDGSVVGMESKFCEWLTPKSPRKVHFKPKYFPEDRALWARVGLARAQQLAEAMNAGERHFRYLDAAQLLKHMLGLATGRPGASSLYYIYYDCQGPEAELHRREVEVFGSLIGPDMPFQWMSYQQAFDRLKASLDVRHADFASYLERRYFPHPCE